VRVCVCVGARARACVLACACVCQTQMFVTYESVFKNTYKYPHIRTFYRKYAGHVIRELFFPFHQKFNRSVISPQKMNRSAISPWQKIIDLIQFFL
jgi:hypothetical protein